MRLPKCVQALITNYGRGWEGIKECDSHYRGQFWTGPWDCQEAGGEKNGAGHCHGMQVSDKGKSCSRNSNRRPPKHRAGKIINLFTLILMQLVVCKTWFNLFSSEEWSLILQTWILFGDLLVISGWITLQLTALYATLEFWFHLPGKASSATNFCLRKNHWNTSAFFCSDGEIAHSKDGFEINVGTNHLGHVLLIHLLTGKQG